MLTMDPETATAFEHPDAPAPAATENLALPHRARAVTVFALAAAGCLAAAALLWGGLRIDLLAPGSPPGRLAGYLALLALAAFVTLASAAWRMGSRDLAGMDAGRVDPAGRARTRKGRTLAMILLTAAVALALSLLCLHLIGIAEIRLLPPEAAG